MIWHNETLEAYRQPAGSTVRLIGIYNPPEDQANHQAIELKLEISTNPEDTSTIILVFAHNPRGLGYEEPTPEDIQRKYNQKVLKIKTKVTETAFNDLPAMKRIS
jgi:hypothetical protein